MNADEALEWLFATQMFGIKLGLEGPRRLLSEYLAIPKTGVRVVQLVGTNGKGSTAAMIDSVARASGLKVGLFTSPHLVHFSERIRVNGRRISDSAIAAGLTELRALVADWEHHPTFFELTLALAMRHFAEQGCELIVMEAGMGGRLDATTAVPADLVVMTPVGLDHVQWLGDSLEAIAGEKCGAIREGKPLVCAPQADEAMRVIAARANERRADLLCVDEPLRGYRLGLRGEHQVWNAALALAALHGLGISLREDAVRRGLVEVMWPGRFELLDEGAVVLDGAHNPHSAEVLAQTWQAEFDEPAALVFGAVESKEVAEIAACLDPLADRVFLVKIPTGRGLELSALEAAWPAQSKAKLVACESVAEALEKARASGRRVLVAGSLFLVGAARAAIAGVPFQASEQ